MYAVCQQQTPLPRQLITKLWSNLLVCGTLIKSNKFKFIKLKNFMNSQFLSRSLVEIAFIFFFILLTLPFFNSDFPHADEEGLTWFIVSAWNRGTCSHSSCRLRKSFCKSKAFFRAGNWTDLEQTLTNSSVLTGKKKKKRSNCPDAFVEGCSLLVMLLLNFCF